MQISENIIVDDSVLFLKKITRVTQDNNALLNFLNKAVEVNTLQDALREIGLKKHKICVIKNIPLSKLIKKYGANYFYLCNFIRNFTINGVESKVTIFDEQDEECTHFFDVFVVNQKTQQKFSIPENHNEYLCDAYICDLENEKDYNLYNHIFKD